MDSNGRVSRGLGAVHENDRRRIPHRWKPQAFHSRPLLTPAHSHLAGVSGPGLIGSNFPGQPQGLETLGTVFVELEACSPRARPPSSSESHTTPPVLHRRACCYSSFRCSSQGCGRRQSRLPNAIASHHRVRAGLASSESGEIRLVRPVPAATLLSIFLLGRDLWADRGGVPASTAGSIISNVGAPRPPVRGRGPVGADQT